MFAVCKLALSFDKKCCFIFEIRTDKSCQKSNSAEENNKKKSYLMSKTLLYNIPGNEK